MGWLRFGGVTGDSLNRSGCFCRDKEWCRWLRLGDGMRVGVVSKRGCEQSNGVA